MLRISIVTNELPPYRIPFFETLDAMPGVSLQAIFCCRREPNRAWEFPSPRFGHVFLKERIIQRGDRYVHNNPDVLRALGRFAPDVVVTGGFNPTHLYAFAWAWLRRVPHVTMTDGSLISESSLGRVHRMLRRFVFQRSGAYLAASNGGLQLLQSYGLAPEDCFKSSLCVDNALFRPRGNTHRRHDFLFCGRFEAVKNPMFALEVAAATARQLGRRMSLLMVGAGSMEPALRERALQLAHRVDVSFREFTPHAELPDLYQSARVFLFPTRWDPWGVVANEACAAGLPVLVSPHAGVAHELVIDQVNGYVLGLDLAAWTSAAAGILAQGDLWQQLSQGAMRVVEDYNYQRTASAFVAACRHACMRSGRRPTQAVRQLED